MKTKVIAIFAFLVLCPFTFSQAHPSAIAPNGETIVSAVLNGVKIRVLFRTSSVPVSDHGDNQKFAQCTNSRDPCSLTSELKILGSSGDIFVPRAAYADLGDILTAELSLKNGHMFLTLQGGDASEAYIARLEFNNERVVKRWIYSAEDTTHPVEVSEYYEISTSD